MIEEEDQLPDAPAEETVTEDAPGEASPYAPDPLPAAPTQPTTVPTPNEASGNVFDQFDKQPNVFDQFDKSSDGESTASGAFVRGAAKGVVPAAAALPAIGFGATIGAEAGAVGGPIGSFVGGLAGGLVGGAAGGVLGSAVQDFALSYVPDDIKKKMGLDEDQAIIDESRHPYASQIGGLTPFLVTARPWAAPSTASIATTLTKRAGSEVLQRGFSGALMGGWEGANEAYHGNVDWNKVAIATAFGTMFPHQNKYGTAVIESGSNAARYTLGKARDLGVFGPGHNEDTFQGDAEVNDVAKQASNQYARDEEAEVQGPRLPGPEQVTDTARKMEPELFTEYDRLTAIKDEARAAIDEVNNGSPKRVSELSKQLVQAQRDYSEHVKSRNGYEGGREARVLRQNIRTIQNEIETLSNRPMEHAETEGADNELTARHRQDLIKADEALRDLAPQITEAKRRAAIGLGRGDFIIEPKAEPPAAKSEQTIAPDYTADRKAIVKEAKQRMLDAGRSEEEAQAYGELTASRYVSRASRFDGKLGTPLELYMSEGAHIRSWEPAKQSQVTPVAEAPAEAPTEITGEVSVAQEVTTQSTPEPATAPATVEPAAVGPKAGDAITMNATKYKIAEINDNSVKLVPARVKDKAAPLTLKRNIFDQMFGEYVAPAAKQEGEKITLNGEPLDEKMAEVVRGLMEKQAAPKESVPGRLPETADMAALRQRMRQEAMSDEYPVVEEAAPDANTEWERLAANVQEKGSSAGLVKWDRLRSGSPNRARATKDWTPGSIVDVGFVKDLLVVGKNDDGSFTLLGKPDSNGESQRYVSEPHKGVSKEGKVDFLLATEALRQTAIASPSSETVRLADELTQVMTKKADEKFEESLARENTPSQQEGAKSLQTVGYDGNTNDPLQGRIDQLKLRLEDSDLTERSRKDLSSRLADFKQFIENRDAYLEGKPENLQLQLKSLRPDIVLRGKNRNGEIIEGAVQGFGKDGVGIADRDGIYHDIRIENIEEVFPYAIPDKPLIVTPEKPSIAPQAETKTNGIVSINANDINVDAKRFQFKSGGDEQGVIEKLKGVKEWDPMLADIITVWQDKDGKYWVADGHQRSGLARRLIAEGHEPIELNAWVLKESNGVTDANARVIAAIKNINNETGTSIDAAKIIRETAEAKGVKLPQFNPNSKLAREGKALANLSPEAFGMVINEVVPTNYGAVVGRLVKDPLQQQEAIRVIAKVKDKINVNQAEIIVKDMLSQGTEMATETGSLFGEEAFASSVVLERAQIVDEAIKLLKSDKKVFKTLVSDSDKIMGHGSNVLDVEANKGRLTEDEQVQAYVEKLATRAGPISDALTAVAKQYKSGEISRAAASRGFIESVKRGTAESLEYGNNARSAEPGAAGGSETKYEPGAEGLDQGLIPGVEPVTDKERMEQAANKPLEGGNQEPPAGGLFDESSRDQKELFQRRGNDERLAGFNTKTREIWLGKNADASSIIHESGHQYLEELKRDAAHAEAPEQIKADIETVKDWVGWKRGQQDFTRKQHEKFAKGFERYLYDGVAPSIELAGAFERFTNWLRGVYQSIRGLKRNGIPELTPEIRSVFDRLLSTEPRRTIVAGEIKTERSLGAVHEAEAVKTTHREAAAVADRAAAERASFVKELPAQVNNELAAAAERNGRSVESLGASAERSRGMAEDSVRQGTRAGSSTSSANSGAQRGSGSEAATESAGASSGTDGNGYVPRERQTFASKEGKFVDKAGNIRLENITNEEDLRDAAREVAAQNDGFIGDRRGVVTDGQVHDLATAIGDEGAYRMVNKWVKGSAYNAEEIMAMRLLFQKQLAKVVELAKTAKAAGEGDWQAMRDYAVERDRLVNIQKTVSGATAEWGRAGRSFRDISGSKDYQTVNKLFQENTGRTLFQTRVELDLLSKLDDPEAAANFLRNSDRPGFHRYILEYWINNLISGPVTHATYMVGNDLLALYRAIPETLARAAVGRAMQAAGRETAGKDLVHFGEALAQVRGFGEGFAPALKAAAGSLKTGVTTLLPGETMRNLPGLMPGQQYAKPEHMDASYKLAHVIPDMFGAIRGMKEAVIAYGQMLDKGVDGAPLWSLHTSPLGVIPDIAYKGVPIVPFGSAIRVPGRFIQAIHAFHRVNFYMMELNAEAYRRAAAEGLSGEEFAQRVAELKKNPDLDMIKRSADAATEGTMMGQGGEFTRNLARLTNTKILGVPWLKFIDPFVHITGNVIEQSLGRRTPLALFSPEMRADLSGKNGTYAQDKAMGRIMLGTAVSAAVAGYVMDGFITGGGPKDREEKGNWERMGIQPYSVKIGDTWYSYHRLGALGLLIGVAADMYKVAKYAAKEELAEAGASLLEAFSHNILEESFMRGPSELFRAIENPNQYGASWARNFLSSFAPASVGMSQITRATDPYSRQARTITDAFMGKYPWWSDQLQPRRDLWGDPIANKQLTLGTAIYQSTESRDPVNQEMYRLNVKKAPVDKKIRNIELSPEQYDDYARIAGRLTKMQLEQVVNSTDYQAMPDFQKMDVIDKVFNVTRKAARETILQKYPQLIHDAITLKMNRYSDEALERQ